MTRDWTWLCCPSCRKSLERVEESLQCPSCTGEYPVRDNQVYFRTEESGLDEEAYRGGLRGRLRRSRSYPWIFRLLAPVVITGPDPARELGSRAEAGERIVDLGCGNDRRHRLFIGVDLLAWPDADLVCEADRLPFPDGSLDAVVSVAVWEHIPDLESVLAEVVRTVRPGGSLFIVVPFLQPFHAAPHDYRRWTLPGLERQLEGSFERVRSGVYCGPASAFVWLLADGIAWLITLGHRRAHPILSLALQAMFSPLKWFDLLLARLPRADCLSSALFIEARRRPPSS